MAMMTIRNIDDTVRDKLRVRAALHGRSMEDEARAILEAAVESPVEGSLVQMLMDMRVVTAGDDLRVPPRRDQVQSPFA